MTREELAEALRREIDRQVDASGFGVLEHPVRYTAGTEFDEHGAKLLVVETACGTMVEGTIDCLLLADVVLASLS